MVALEGEGWARFDPDTDMIIELQGGARVVGVPADKFDTDRKLGRVGAGKTWPTALPSAILSTVQQADL